MDRNEGTERRAGRSKSQKNILLQGAVSLFTVLVTLLTVTLLLLTGARGSFAVVVDSSNCGLVVEVSDEPVHTGNLNPGDNKSSYLIARNIKEAPLNYWMDIEIVSRTRGSYREQPGHFLEEVLQLTVRRDNQVLFDGFLSQFSELNMGALAGNAQQRIDVIAHLDGPAVGNAYQGASVSVVFKFRSSCTPPPGTEEEATEQPDVPTFTASAALSVHKFHDLNGEGLWDAGEPEIAGWVVLINGREYATPVNNLLVDPGLYTVAEALREGWEPTTPAELTLVLAAGESKSIYFGNRQEEGLVEVPTVPPGLPGLPPPPGEEELTVEPAAPAVPGLPRTGELPPYYYYGAGALLLLAGMLLGLKSRGTGKVPKR